MQLISQHDLVLAQVSYVKVQISTWHVFKTISTLKFCHQFRKDDMNNDDDDDDVDDDYHEDDDDCDDNDDNSDDK